MPEDYAMADRWKTDCGIVNRDVLGGKTKGVVVFPGNN